MKAIEQHINNMFQDLPATQEIERIKNDLYLNALDRYDELISQGKKESEALGTIIIEIGDLDVLLDDFGYDKEKDLESYSLNTLEEVKYFIEFNRSASNKMALGTFIILFGVGLIPTLYTFNAAMLGVILFLILIAIAVGTLTMTGMKLDNLEKNLDTEENIFYMSDDDYDTIYDQYMLFKETENYRVPLGIMLSILAVVPIIIFSFMENELLIERFGVLLLMTILGIGISQFIKYGMVHSAFERVLSIGEYSVEERQLQKRLEPISSIYWITTTLIFLIWSFLTMDWHITWVIWPIAGFMWAIISILFGMFNERDESQY
jgi:hypothetical protein